MLVVSIAALRTKPPKSDTAGGSGAKKSKRARRDESEKKFVESRDLLRSADTGAGGGGGAGGMAGLYKPKTADTRQTYEVMLSFIQVSLRQLGRKVKQHDSSCSNTVPTFHNFICWAPSANSFL